MKEFTLVIMAAGMGSRFGGLKQLTPVDNDGNFLIDYSVYDAIQAGFHKVVFVIREEHLSLFEETIGKRIAPFIQVEYAFQDIKDVPITLDLAKREKPWGTVQAVLASRSKVTGPFVIINADDFYGREAFFTAANFLEQTQEPFTYACISYPFFTTMSSKGAVKRGVLKVDGKKIQDMIECSIEKSEDGFLATPLEGGASFSIPKETPVSMNFFAFQNDFYQILEESWQQFFQNDLEYIYTHEALLPDCLKEHMANETIHVLHCPSNSKWIGMTYREDLENVKTEIQKLKEKEVYPNHLWE